MLQRPVHAPVLPRPCCSASAGTATAACCPPKPAGFSCMLLSTCAGCAGCPATAFCGLTIALRDAAGSCSYASLGAELCPTCMCGACSKVRKQQIRAAAAVQQECMQRHQQVQVHGVRHSAGVCLEQSTSARQLCAVHASQVTCGPPQMQHAMCSQVGT